MTISQTSFLFLQGPPGPFFAQLAALLRSCGYACERINFNGGDRLDWTGSAIDFTGNLESFPAFFESILLSRQINAILLYGDCRPLHRAACRIAKALGIEVYVFEEGYIRPDWITLERGGVNGFSRLPRDPATYLELAEALDPLPEHRSLPANFRLRAREALTYFLGYWFFAIYYAGYRSHRPYSAVSELGGWIGKFIKSPLARARSTRNLERLGQQPFYLFPLQLDSDHQIRTHSPFTGMRDALETVLQSFAIHAPPNTVLLVKEHPLDNGLHFWRQVTERMAARLGIGDRVLFITHGDLNSIVAAARGVVTVNSTTGTLALASGIPVAVLGKAVYDLPGITHQGNLDGFWQHPGRPQIELYEAFERVLASRCLLRGGFSTVAGRSMLLPLAAARLIETSRAGPSVLPDLREAVNA